MKGVFTKNEILTKRINEVMEELKDDKKYALKMSAIKDLITVERPYDNHCFDNKILVDLYLKKIDMILKANTKKEIKEILSTNHIKYNGAEIIPTEFNIIEEELLMWSLTSLKAPLTGIGLDRYLKIFSQYYGEDMLNQIK